MGSSASTSSGRFISARATATRCFCPPDRLADGEVDPVGQPHPHQQFAPACPGRGGLAPLAHGGGEDHVFQRGEIGQQVVELEDEADVAGCGTSVSARSSAAIRSCPSIA